MLIKTKSETQKEINEHLDIELKEIEDYIRKLELGSPVYNESESLHVKNNILFIRCILGINN